MSLGTVDSWRLETRPGGAPWTEWQHFLVQLPDLHVLVNLSWDQALDGGRSIVVAWDGAWAGGVEVFRGGRVGIVPGRIDARLGRTRLTFDGLRYHLHLRMDSGAVKADLSFTPTCDAVPSYNLKLGTRPMSWVQLPRLVVSGRIALNDREHTLAGAPAYHDHNWGRFRWADDFAWEWGTIAPRESTSPWSFALLRTTDRGRRRLRDRVLYVFKEGRRARLFEPHQIRVRSPGTLTPPDQFTVPAAAHLLLPGALGDLPADMTFSAQDGDDVLELRVVGRRLARIVIPEEDGVGVVVINQVFVRGEAEGRIGGEDLQAEGSGVVEMIRGHRHPCSLADIPPRRRRTADGSLGSLLARALDRIERKQPEHCAAILGALGPLRVAVDCGAESFGFAADCVEDRGGDDGLPAWGTPLQGAGHDLCVRLDRRALRALVGGELTLEQAIARRRVDVQGTVPDVLALHRTVTSFVHAALRTPGLEDLHRELMEERP